MKITNEAERARWLQFVAEQPLPLDCECKRWRKSRSNDQNAMLWAMYEPIAEHMGYDRDDIHEWFCGKFFGWHDVRVPKTPRNPEGLASVPVRSTTRDEHGKRNVIDRATFAKFVDMVDRIAAQAGVYVPRAAA